jgi:hypothetical protein
LRVISGIRGLSKAEENSHRIKKKTFGQRTLATHILIFPFAVMDQPTIDFLVIQRLLAE